MAQTQDEISAVLGELHALAPAGYALGFHIEYTTPKFMFQTYSKDWLDYYSQNGLVMTDPTVAWSFENTSPRRWSAMDDPAGVLEAAARHGLIYGVSFAVSAGDSRSMAGFSHGSREFSDDEIETMVGLIEHLHDAMADQAKLDNETVAQLKKMSIMVTHPGS